MCDFTCCTDFRAPCISALNLSSRICRRDFVCALLPARCCRRAIILRVFVYKPSAECRLNIIMGLLQGKHPKFYPEWEWGIEKVAPWRTKPAISLKRLKIERKLLLTAYIKSYTSFRLPPKFIPRDAPYRAWNCRRKSSVCPSFCVLSRIVITWIGILQKYFHGWLGQGMLSADPNIMGLLQGEHPQILAGIGVVYGKVACKVQNRQYMYLWNGW